MSLSQLNNLLKEEFEYRLAFLTMKNGKSMRRLSTCKVVNLLFSFFSTPIWLERIFICSITPMIIKILIFCEIYKLQSLFYFKITLNHDCEFYLRNFSYEPTLKSKACLKFLYFTIIIFDLCRYLEYFSYLYTIN